MKKYLLSIVILFFLGIASTSLAQYYMPAGLNEQIEASMVPSRPGPNESVRITLTEYVPTDLRKVKLDWYLNGVLEKSGIGATTFDFITGDVGSTSKINIVITKSNGLTISKSITVRPAEIDLIVEPTTYTPPFYEGRAKFTYESGVRIVAIPNFINENGRRVPAEELVYEWEVDSKNDQEQSGYGKNVLYLPSYRIPTTKKIILEVSEANLKTKAMTIMSVRPTSPELIAYKDNPLTGINFYSAVLGETSFLGDEMSIAAIPFCFSVYAPDEFGIDYQWKMNGRNLEDPAQKNVLAFRRVGGQTGRTEISISAKQNSTYLQSSSASFSFIVKDGDVSQQASAFSF